LFPQRGEFSLPHRATLAQRWENLQRIGRIPAEASTRSGEAGSATSGFAANLLGGNLGVMTAGSALRQMLPGDHAACRALWERDPAIGLSDADSECAIAAYLERNPGGSFVAVVGDEVVGTILCGHDGRRGYIHHLYVAPGHRMLGLGRQLVEAGLDYFGREGLGKCHLFIFGTNEPGKHFWRRVGFVQRDDLDVFSFSLSDSAPC